MTGRRYAFVPLQRADAVDKDSARIEAICGGREKAPLQRHPARHRRAVAVAAHGLAVEHLEGIRHGEFMTQGGQAINTSWLPGG